MTELYTVRFTTKTPVKKYNGRGKVIAETLVETPIELPGLTLKQAQSYEANSNFRMERFYGKPKASKGNGRDQGVGNGAKRVSHSSAAAVTPSRSLAKPAAAIISTTVAAARTGNLGAAIHG